MSYVQLDFTTIWSASKALDTLILMEPLALPTWIIRAPFFDTIGDSMFSSTFVQRPNLMWMLLDHSSFYFLNFGIKYPFLWCSICWWFERSLWRPPTIFVYEIWTHWRGKDVVTDAISPLYYDVEHTNRFEYCDIYDGEVMNQFDALLRKNLHSVTNKNC